MLGFRNPTFAMVAFDLHLDVARCCLWIICGFLVRTLELDALTNDVLLFVGPDTGQVFVHSLHLIEVEVEGYNLADVGVVEAVQSTSTFASVAA